MSRAPIPVIVVAGFLGSGKTTLLNHLLRTGGAASGTRIGVLVNDFGAVNIDAMLVAGQADGAVSLTNGCMCCSVDRDGLEAALDSLLRPSARLDAIVIEASGIAEPKALIRMVVSAADPRMRYGGLIYVVDAAMFERIRTEHPEIDGHVGVADLVMVNKADLVDADALAHLRTALAELNSTAAQVTVTDARIDPQVLFDPVAADGAGTAGPGRGPQQLTLDALLAESDDRAGGPDPDDHHADDHVGHGHPHPHLHDSFTSVHFGTDEAMDPRALAAFLERPPAGCYRIKGIVWFDLPGHRQRFVVHGVGGFVEVRRESWSGRPRSTSLVAIGAGMDEQQVLTGLRAAVATAATGDDEHGILHITRHLPTR
ncbi:CobW family GTP-binding protein [Gordonia sp. VNQ95]|jgi:G3E family GTPase|uniref:CobW family GTP-binding protein n=1 Tax=Gordonia sp. VNQ95 TaxID=3156619 RepID=UPI0032B5D62D